MKRTGIMRRRELFRTTNRTSLSDGLPALFGLLACSALLPVRGEEAPASRLSSAHRSLFSLSLVFFGGVLRERSVVIVVMSLIFRGQRPHKLMAQKHKSVVAILIYKYDVNRMVLLGYLLLCLFLNPFE